MTRTKTTNEAGARRLKVVSLQPMPVPMAVDVIPLFYNRVQERGVPHSPLHD